MELIASLGFLVFGCGLFLFVIGYVSKDSDKLYERRLAEAREFGFDPTSKHTIDTLAGRKRQK